ncbi:MAG: hypothetical protein NWE88_06130 [Candidatus Bathyarchaeota archaeon]|nr:hypothetical protein [Candidatus Bathyarchaeota archaeon]
MPEVPEPKPWHTTGRPISAALPTASSMKSRAGSLRIQISLLL